MLHNDYVFSYERPPREMVRSRSQFSKNNLEKLHAANESG